MPIESSLKFKILACELIMGASFLTSFIVFPWTEDKCVPVIERWNLRFLDLYIFLIRFLNKPYSALLLEIINIFFYLFSF